MSDIFSYNRVSLQIRSYALTHYKSWLTATLALFGILLLYSSVIKSNQRIDNLYQNWFFGILYIGGIILASKALNGMYQKSQNIDFFLTPTSSLEKTLTPLLIINIFFPIYLIIAMTCGSFLIEVINSLFSNENSATFNFYESDIISNIPLWLTIQTAYFLGSAWFSKNNLIKTTIALCITITSFLIFTRLCLKVILPELHISTSFNTLTIALKNNSSILTIGAIALVLSWWLLAWLKVKEMEVQHGV